MELMLHSTGEVISTDDNTLRVRVQSEILNAESTDEHGQEIMLKLLALKVCN